VAAQRKELTMNLIPRKTQRTVSRPNAGPIDSLRTEMDRLFDSFFQDPWSVSSDVLPSVATALEVIENENDVVVRAEVPGIEPKDIEVTLQEGMLTIAGEKKDQCEQQQGEGRRYSECRYGAFRRMIQLPTQVDESKVQASHENGVLTIRMPKSEAQKPRRIEISGAGDGASRRGEREVRAASRQST
jgi:HSP20 family protein